MAPAWPIPPPPETLTETSTLFDFSTVAKGEATGFSLLLGFAIFGYVATVDHEVSGSFHDSDPCSTRFSAARSNKFC